jgi:hypothetical protein
LEECVRKRLAVNACVVKKKKRKKPQPGGKDGEIYSSVHFDFVVPLTLYLFE